MSKPRTETPDNQTEPTSQASGAVSLTTTNYSTRGASAQVWGNNPSPSAAAERYVEVGAHPLPVMPRTKIWLADSKYRDTKPKLALVGDWFNPDSNVGLLTGPASGNLSDMDCDSDEVIRVAAYRLPDHAAVHGRASAAKSHYWFRITDLSEDIHDAYNDPIRKDKDATLVELRASSNHQTVVPPSTHESGEKIRWLNDRDGLDDPSIEITVVPVRRRLVPEIAAAALLARYAVGSQDFNNATLALISWLARAHWERERIITLVGSVRYACGAESMTGGRDDRHRIEQLVDDSLKRLEEDKPTSGFPKVCEYFGGETVIKAVAKWLGILDRVLHPEQPRGWANAGLSELYEVDGVRTLLWSQGSFYRWRHGAYERIDDSVVRTEVAEVLEKYNLLGEKGPRPFPVTNAKMQEVVAALRDKCNVDRYGTEPPTWLVDDKGYDPEKIIAFRNGLYYVPTGEFLPPTPHFFTLNALEIDYDPNAPKPTEWLKFLHKLWGKGNDPGGFNWEGDDWEGDDWEGDDSCIQTLQEWFGYLLLPDTTQQKIMLMVGPKRSGKGTIARTLKAVVGHKNTGNPTLNTLGQRFGLEDLIGKTAATITDIRLSGRTDVASVAERLLSVSGEDSITIDRKYIKAWTGQLRARFTLMTNELPRIADASGALASRFIILPMHRSFYGKEDLELWNRLQKELPGIVNWAIEGYRELHKRGYFVPPVSGQDEVEELEALSSPIKAFVEKHCEIEAGAETPTDKLYKAYTAWCRHEGRNYPATKQIFSRDLKSAYTSIQVEQKTEGKNRIRVYRGIKIVEMPEEDF